MHLVAFSFSDCVCNWLTVIVTDTLFTSLHSYFERDLLPEKRDKTNCKHKDNDADIFSHISTDIATVSRSRRSDIVTALLTSCKLSDHSYKLSYIIHALCESFLTLGHKQDVNSGPPNILLLLSYTVFGALDVLLCFGLKIPV